MLNFLLVNSVKHSRIHKQCENFSNYIWSDFSFQVKSKQKKKPNKAIRINEEGDASLEDLTNCLDQGTANHDTPMDPEGPKSSNKKVSLYFL